MNVRDLAKAFNKKFKLKKTEAGIKSAIENHKIRCGRKPKDRLITKFRLFTAEQIQLIRTSYQDKSISEMRDLFNATFETDMTWQQIKTFVSNRGITSGRSGQFGKGHKSWNKGTKGLTGPNKTSFKKGSIPKNRKGVGTERICSKDGYVLVKVPERDPHTGFQTRWKHKHVYMWEQEHGPVPEGMVVVFRDGDKLNIETDNLMLISRAELLQLNRHGYKDAPAELKPSVLALARVEVKTFSSEKILKK